MTSLKSLLDALYCRAAALDKYLNSQMILVLDGKKWLNSALKVMQMIRACVEGQRWDLKKQQNIGK